MKLIGLKPNVLTSTPADFVLKIPISKAGAKIFSMGESKISLTG